MWLENVEVTLAPQIPRAVLMAVALFHKCVESFRCAGALSFIFHRGDCCEGILDHQMLWR